MSIRTGIRLHTSWSKSFLKYNFKLKALFDDVVRPLDDLRDKAIYLSPFKFDGLSLSTISSTLKAIFKNKNGAIFLSPSLFSTGLYSDALSLKGSSWYHGRNTKLHWK